jgi:hypothetical protein
MIMGMFAGFVVICVMMLFFYGVSLAITFWFISIPLFAFWFFVEVKRTQRRAKVPLSPRAQYYLDLHLARLAALDRLWLISARVSRDCLVIGLPSVRWGSGFPRELTRT